MRLEVINKLKETPGTTEGANLYDEAVKEGIISISVNCWFEMFNYFKTRIIVNKEYNDCRARAYTETSESFNVSEMTIRRAVNYMKS